MTTADVVVENFRPGALAAKGLAYDDVRRSNPGVVYCSISGFGTAGGATLPGYDFLVQAVGGLMSITGGTDAEPTKVGVALVDVLTSKDAVIGILAALNERHASGEGQQVEVNLLSSLLGSLANQASSYLATGVAPHRMGNQHPSIAPYETLRCGLDRVGVDLDDHDVQARACGDFGDARSHQPAADDPDAFDPAHERSATSSVPETRRGMLHGLPASRGSGNSASGTP